MHIKIRDNFLCLTAIFFILMSVLVINVFQETDQMVDSDEFTQLEVYALERINDENTLDASNVITNEFWSLRYPSELKMEIFGDGSYYFTTSDLEDKWTFFDRYSAEPSQLHPGEFMLGHARLNDETGPPIFDLYKEVTGTDPNPDAIYERLIIGPYQGLRVITMEKEEIFVRTGISDLWVFYIFPPSLENRQMFEEIISTITID